MEPKVTFNDEVLASYYHEITRKIITQRVVVIFWP